MIPHFVKIICPNCHHSHEIPDQYLGDASRLLKCASCETIWRHVVPSFISNETENKTKPIANPTPAYEVPPLPPPHVSRPAFSTPPHLRQETVLKHKKRSFKGWIFLFVLVGGGILFYQQLEYFPSIQKIVLEWQQYSTSLYQGIKKMIFPLKAEETSLSLHVLTSNLSIQDNEALIKVKVQISNKTNAPQQLLPLQFKLIDKDPNDETEFLERQTWSFPLEGKTLKPGEDIIIESSTTSYKKDPPFTVVVSFRE